MAKESDGRVALLVDLLEQSYRRKSWHGPNLRGSLRRVSAADAAWRPGPKRKSVWEIATHAAYWKYTIRRRLTGEKRGSFELKGNNWFPLPADRSEAAWRQTLSLLDREHDALLKLVEGLSESDLRRKAPGSALTNLFVITGIASHDVYHAGQIQTLKRLCADAGGRKR
jgi:uncharacterized damage-inducible protein DinB